MKYQFPLISHLDEVKSVVQDVDGFIVAERDWGWVVNYVQMGPQIFPEVLSVEDAIRRECRGLIFDRSGNLISRPYHKFFNVGERTETLIEKISLDQPHNFLEKLDGSMIRPIMTQHGLRLGTKMGITDVSMQPEVWMSDHPEYEKFMLECIEDGKTPIFEWCSRKQKIVIDYPIDRLVLTAIRDNHTGVYLSYTQMQDRIRSKIDIVRYYDGSVSSMDSLVAETHDLKGQEGWILRFEDGHMVKIKASEYVTIHKAKDNILRENGVINLMLEEKIDDVKPFLLDEDREKLEEYESKFWHGIAETAEDWKRIDAEMRVKYSRSQRKEFALNDANKLNSFLKSAIFKAWDNPNYDWRDAVLSRVQLGLGSQAKVDEVRPLWGNATWNIKGSEDE